MDNVIQRRRYKSIVVLTGAGVSKASGLKTFRGADGIWSDPGAKRLSLAETLVNEPENYWRFWGKLKDAANGAVANQGHIALARWESGLNADQRFLLITQNVDGLHQRAGSRNVAELHGSLYRTRCTGISCPSKPYRDIESHSAKVPYCQVCGAVLRPDVVMFNEALPADAEHHAKRALRDCDLFIAVGTSGNVSPASSFVDWAKYAQSKTVLINQDVSEAPASFDIKIEGLAEIILPQILQ